MKRGSVIVESMISIMVLMICGCIVVNAINCINKTKQKRKLSFDLNSYINIVIYKVKYDMNKEKVKELFSNKKTAYIKYDEKYIDNIIEDDICNMICKEKPSECFLELKITDDKNNDKYINFKITGERECVKVEEEFKKSWWMDEA